MHYLCPQDVSIVVLEVLEYRLDLPNLIIQESLSVLIMPHPHIVPHVVVMHYVIHVPILYRRSVHTWLRVLPLHHQLT